MSLNSTTRLSETSRNFDTSYHFVVEPRSSVLVKFDDDDDGILPSARCLVGHL